ncbi:MAG TPA: SDR family NAD(P)-dependent oxidoreductase [Actinomycetota bacterium]|nr:SDR family NAD(P)-dependent oxidoreductase [Actinomycetota bacterium]
MSRKRAVVTGASGGIGAATAIALAEHGFDVILGARRLDRLEPVAKQCGGTALALDVTDPASVDEFVRQTGDAHVLINNAGGAKGLDRIEDAVEERWRWMWETNVLGLMRITKAFLPALIASGDGHIVNIGSTAGLEAYEGGAGYTSVKHGVRAITQTLRLELLGRPVRVSEIDPGLVETEFSRVRFDGDEDRAATVYAGLTPLTADDIAAIVAFVVTRPGHVNIDQVVVRPRDQATSTRVHRRQ